MHAMLQVSQLVFNAKKDALTMIAFFKGERKI
jgi:hypothetical protein